MPVETLTARRVAALTTDEVQEEFWDALVPGLALRVGRGGTKTYIVRYRAAGKHRRVTIGRHPIISLADARDKARALIAGAVTGEDPAAERHLRRSTDTTFAALAREVLDSKAASWRDKTRRERKRIIDAELVPKWGDRPAASISRRDVVELVERIAKRAPVMANRVLATVKVIYNVGLDREFPTLESNPAARLKPVGEEQGRSRFLATDELRAVWGALEWESTYTKALFRFTLLTAQRVGSVRAMRWSEIDDADVWHIPAASFKGKRDHLVPLSREALAILKTMKPLSGEGEHVFPGRKQDAGRSSINKALQRTRERTELENWTIHDFRTTFRTHATRAAAPAHKRDPRGLGVAPNVADAVLGHKEASLGFDRYTGEPERYLLAEKRNALAKWGRFVIGLVKGRGKAHG